MRTHVVEEWANEEEDVIRSKANWEDSNHSIGEQTHLPLSLAAQARTLAHRCQHPPVADGQHQQGQKEAEAHSDKVEQGDGFLQRVGLVTTAVVVDVIVGTDEFVTKQHKDVRHRYHNVNGDTLCPGEAHGAMGLVAERVADHDASVHRDAAQQVDADVHVGVVEEARYAAGGGP